MTRSRSIPDVDRRPASELDRVLGDWLADGPRRAPAAPVTVAIRVAPRGAGTPAPARSLAGVPARPHGRSRNSARLHRRSPAFALRPVGLRADGRRGCRRRLRPAVRMRSAAVPSPVAPIPSASPVASPTALPSPTPHVFDVTLDIGISQPVTITIEDHSNRIVRAEDVSAQGSAPMPAGDLDRDPRWMRRPSTSPGWTCRARPAPV